MINANTALWLIVILFGFIGSMRLVKREFLVLVSIVLALYAVDVLLNSSNQLVNLVPDPPQPATAEQINSVRIRRFLLLAIPFLFVVFLGYLGPAIASAAIGGNLAARARASVQPHLLGFAFGLLNGYCIVATLVWYAWKVLILSPQSFPIGSSNPWIVPPQPPGNWSESFFVQYAPPMISSSVLILIMVLFFLIVIYAYV